MSEDKVIKLPNRNEIVKRMMSVYDDAYTAERFYPLIAEEADRELVAEGVVMMFTLKIHDFVSEGYPEGLVGILHMWVPAWIDALVDDETVAEQAKQFHKEAMDAARG